MDQLLFTPSAVIGLLAQISELSDYEIDCTESSDRIDITIGESTYQIVADNAVEVEVSDESMEDVAEANEEGYQEVEEGATDVYDNVEGGLIKELLKTLALGGLVRLTKNALEKS